MITLKVALRPPRPPRPFDPELLPTLPLHNYEEVPEEEIETDDGTRIVTIRVHDLHELTAALWWALNTNDNVAAFEVC